MPDRAMNPAPCRFPLMSGRLIFLLSLGYIDSDILIRLMEGRDWIVIEDEHGRMGFTWF